MHKVLFPTPLSGLPFLHHIIIIIILLKLAGFVLYIAAKIPEEAQLTEQLF